MTSTGVQWIQASADVLEVQIPFTVHTGLCNHVHGPCPRLESCTEVGGRLHRDRRHLTRIQIEGARKSGAERLLTSSHEQHMHAILLDMGGRPHTSFEAGIHGSVVAKTPLA